MKIVGFDPGTKITGSAVIDIVSLKRVELIHHSSIKIPSSLDHQNKLLLLYQEAKKILHDFHPDLASMEGIFAKYNIQSAFKIGQARGVLMLALAEMNIKAVEFSPREVKKSVTGNGNASKLQVAYMIKHFFPNIIESSYDETDAVAIALTLFHRISLKLC